MKVFYDSRQGQGSSSFLLVNKNGSYLSLSDSNVSHYQGWVLMQEGEPYKVIEQLRPEGTLQEIHNHFSHISRVWDKGTEELSMSRHCVIQSFKEYTGKVQIWLDCRSIKDFSDSGRIYEINEENGMISVRYVKHRDNSLREAQHETWIVIQGLPNHKIIGLWKWTEYSYDASRKDREGGHVYDALEFNVEGEASIIYSVGNTKQEAVERLNHALQHKNDIRESYSHYLAKTLTFDDVEINTAVRALDRLTIKDPFKEEGTPAIIAGLPWFNQVWTRDELVSLGGYISLERHYLAKEILQRQLAALREDSTMPCRIPSTDLGGADGTGWLFFRWLQFITKLQSAKVLKDFLTNEELSSLLVKAEMAIEQQIERGNALIENGPLETWMDTCNGDDVRKGARIEIQALWLSACKLVRELHRILGNPNGADILRFEETLKKSTREALFHEGRLHDGIFEGKLDTRVRPNIFLAYYVYPELLTKQEWKQAFVYTLDELWLEWGGLSSISRNDPLYCSEHTGMDNKSYHRGDSWFWINNVAAIVMNRVDSNLFKYYVHKIKKASVEEMLFHGFVGHCAEISSAAKMESKGCWAQAWSAGTLIELLVELGEK
ncbi:MAG: amylo-alpha-1,6-glucosidase [Candidatus Woesearchaeota archaeon]